MIVLDTRKYNYVRPHGYVPLRTTSVDILIKPLHFYNLFVLESEALFSMLALKSGRLITARNLHRNLRPIITSQRSRQISTYNVDIAGLTEEQAEVCQ